MEVRRKNDAGTKLHVTVTYELDGQRVIEDFGYDTTANKREILRTDGVALAVTVTTKTFDEGQPNERKDKLGPVVDPDDPLHGL